MAEKVDVEIKVETQEAKDKIDEIIDKIDEINDNIKGAEQAAKNAETATTKLSNGFKGVGLAIKAAGIGLVLKVVDQLTTAMGRNQEVADTVATAFNMIGLVFNKIISTVKTVFDRITGLTDNFDALGRLIKNLMTIAITPLKLAFNGIALVIKETQLAWEKSWLGKGDQKRIAELTAQITGYKQEIKDASEEAIAAGKGIVVDFRAGIGEISNMGRVVVEEFNNTFKGVTVSSLKDQAKAITQATSNLSLLEAEHQRVIVAFEKQAEEQRRIRDDISQSIDDRIAANEELLTISEKQVAAEIEALEKQKGALATQLKLQVDNKEIKAQIFALNTAIIEAEKREESLAKERDEQKNALLQERIDNQNQLNQIIQNEFDLQREQINQEEEARKQLATRTISDAKELQAMLTTIEGDAERKRTEIKRKEEEAKFAVVSSTMGAISNLIGSETAVGKALAIGQAIINTKQAAVAALAPPPVGAGPIFGPIAAAGAIATGLANIKGIVSTKLPGEEGGVNPDVGTIDAGSSEDPLENAEPIVPTFGAITAEAPPVQAFVVESDVSSSQALQNDLNLQATL